jgi:hypothetical protein
MGQAARFSEIVPSMNSEKITMSKINEADRMPLTDDGRDYRAFHR